MKSGAAVFLCNGQQNRLTLSIRDVGLLDGKYFFRDDCYRALFGLDFVKGLGAPPTGKVLCSHRRQVLILLLRQLLNALEDQRDLISYSYQYRFSEGPEKGRRCGGATTGFRVDGLHGYVSVRPSGYCYVELSEVAPTQRSRVVQIIDMRTRKKLRTDDWGVMTVSRRKAGVGWFGQLPGLIQWLGECQGDDVEILHA